MIRHVGEKKMKEDLRTQLSKKMIKNGLLELLNHKKSYDINVRELCDKAGVNRSTFYRHYDNIADVLDEIVEDIGKIITDTNASSYSDPDHADDYIYQAVRFFDEHHEYDPLILSDQISLQMVFDRFEQLIMPGIGVSLSDIERRYLVKYLLGGTYAIIKDWVLNQRKESAKQIADILYRLSFKTAG